MKIHNVEQGTPSWLALRAGVVTASEADALVTPLAKPRKGQGVETYLNRKVAERILGFPEQTGSAGFFADQGSMLEKMAIPYFSFYKDLQVERVGFITGEDGKCGASPDGLIGLTGGLECKCPIASTMVGYLREGIVPPEYLPQIHFALWITRRTHWWFCAYHTRFPGLILRVEREQEWDDLFDNTVLPFVKQIDEAEANIRRKLA
jgi:hypothetical protein